MFRPYFRYFFVTLEDPIDVQRAKLDILVHLACESNLIVILSELESYILHLDGPVISYAVQSIAKCALRIPVCNSQCMKTLLMLLGSKRATVVGEVVVMVRLMLAACDMEKKGVVVQYLVR